MFADHEAIPLVAKNIGGTTLATVNKAFGGGGWLSKGALLFRRGVKLE